MKDYITKVEYLSGLDKEGRCSFVLYRMDNYFAGHPKGEHRVAERGQTFNAIPSEYSIPNPDTVPCPYCQSLKKSESYHRFSFSCGKCGNKIILTNRRIYLCKKHNKKPKKIKKG